MIVIEKITKQFVDRGFVELSEDKTPKKLLWQPDLLFSMEGYIYLVLVKSNNSVPPSFLNRVAVIPSSKLVPIIIFSQKPTPTDEKNILSLGISVGYFLRGKLTNLNIKKRLSRQVVRKKINKKKLNAIDIFISSKQDIPERIFVEDRIEFIRKAYSYPFNTPHLIEYDKFKLNKLYKHIDEVMDNCEWIVIVLEDNYSKDVSYEINKAIKKIDHDNIFMFVKSTKICHNIWKKELNKVKKLESRSIKYLPYSNLSDLEVRLIKAINSRMSEICKKKGIEIFV